MMPWQESTQMSLRLEFCQQAMKPDRNMRQLCRRFNISAKTGYKWLARYQQDGLTGLQDQSRRPHHSPTQTPKPMITTILAVRQQHTAWGGKKIYQYLKDQGTPQLPHPNTITRILKRHGCITEAASQQATPPKRFEQATPNACWQMDFKGHFQIDRGTCHPLDILDDHSHFCLCLQACEDEQKETVKTRLITVFQRYGLPQAMLMDNGPPWGYTAEHPYTQLAVWLMRLGIRVWHGRPGHPQTQGKLERFHRTLQVELLQDRHFPTIAACQAAFDQWRDCYNLERPHEGIDMQTPMTRFRPSPRSYPKALPEVVYLDDDDIYRVNLNGMIQFKKRQVKVTRGLINERVAVRPLNTDGLFGIFYGSLKLREINLNEAN